MQSKHIRNIYKVIEHTFKHIEYKTQQDIWHVLVYPLGAMLGWWVPNICFFNHSGIHVWDIFLDTCLDFFSIFLEDRKQSMFVSYCSPPGRELLPHWGWGWVGETIRGQYLYHHSIE